MVTLTIDPASVVPIGTGPDQLTRGSVRQAAQSWHRLSIILGREFGRLHYYRGLELTKAGTAHLHVIVRVDSVSDFWRLRSLVRRNVVRAGFGRVVQSDLARSSEAVVRYVTKADGGQSAGSRVAAYVTKGIDGRFPRWTRRASWSREWSDWTPATPIAGFRWRVAQAARSFVVDGLVASDFVLVDPARYRIRAAGPPGVIA